MNQVTPSWSFFTQICFILFSFIFTAHYSLSLSLSLSLYIYIYMCVCVFIPGFQCNLQFLRFVLILSSQEITEHRMEKAECNILFTLERILFSFNCFLAQRSAVYRYNTRNFHLVLPIFIEHFFQFFFHSHTPFASHNVCNIV